MYSQVSSDMRSWSIVSAEVVTDQYIETPRREPRLASTENRSATLIREPKEEVTDPELYSSGFVSHGKIGATNGDKETLDPGRHGVRLEKK